MFLQCWESIFITAICAPLAGLGSFCNGLSIIPSIINWMSMDSTLEISLCGIVCSVLFEKQMPSLPNVVFPMDMRKTWGECSSFEMNIDDVQVVFRQAKRHARRVLLNGIQIVCSISESERAPKQWLVQRPVDTQVSTVRWRI